MILLEKKVLAGCYSSMFEPNVQQTRPLQKYIKESASFMSLSLQQILFCKFTHTVSFLWFDTTHRTVTEIKTWYTIVLNNIKLSKDVKEQRFINTICSWEIPKTRNKFSTLSFF